MPARRASASSSPGKEAPVAKRPAPAKANAPDRNEIKRRAERRRIAEVNKSPFAPGVADAPFGHCGRLYRHQMRDTMLAMIPVVLTTTLIWGYQVLIALAAATATAVACEAAMSLILKKPPLRILNLNSAVIGLTLALLLPAGTPVWLLIVASAVAVILGKMLLVSESRPILNPALVGWLAVAVLWPTYLQATQSPLDKTFIDAVAMLREGGTAAIADLDLSVLFTGQQLGGLGAADVRDVMLGGMYILYRRNINWRILISFFIGAIALATVMNLINPAAYAGAAFHVYAGSFFFGAIFLVGDFSAAPIRTRPAVLYGLGAGALVVLLRAFGPFPDAVPPAILAINALAFAARRLNALGRLKPQPVNQS